MAAEATLGRAAVGIGGRLAVRGALAALGPLGWVAIGALTAYDAYQIYNAMSESAGGDDALEDKPAEECTGECAERKKKEDEKIEEMDEGSTQEPGDKNFNQNRPGDMSDANQDFDDFNPSDVEDIGNGGRRGTLSDGRRINVRPNSGDGRPTLEIQRPDGRRPIRKYRYGPSGAGS